jgi:signal transduction histidine kinase
VSKSVKDTSLIKILNEVSWEYKNSNLDSALYYGKYALQESIFLQNEKSIAHSYNSIGSAFQAKSEADSAIYYHKKSLEIKKTIKDSIGIADSYNNLGIILDEQGNYLEALNNYFYALNIYEKKSTNFDQIPAVLVNIGIVYKKQEKFDKVLEYYKRALDIYKENNFQIGIVITTGNIGSVYLKTGDYEKAIKYCSDAKNLYAYLGYNRYVPYMDVNIAAAEYHLNKFKASINRYLDVINKFETQNNYYELSNAKIGISKTYISTNQYYKSKIQLTEALELSQKNNFKEFEVEALKYLSEVNFLLKNFKEAYSFQEKYHNKKDSLFEIKKVKAIDEMLIKYETTKKEKEIAIQKEELLEQKLKIKSKNLYTLILVFLLLTLGIIFFAIFKKNQFKKQQLQKEIDLKDALSKIKTQNRLQEQRLRISRDLHDNIGSQLTFIISSIDNLKFISKDADEKLRGKLANISSFTSLTISELRDTIWAMNKSEISVEDLHARILSFVEKAKIAIPETTFKVTYDINKNSNFSSLVGMNLFRVVQEAINNAVKYADAQRIIIEISKNNQDFIISIIDNGEGFDINTIDLGNGLSNMEKRMSEINGKVNIFSEANNGTEIRLELTVKNTPNDV